MKNRVWARKGVILAGLALSLSSCDGSSPFGGGSPAVIAQASITDPRARAFYAARQWRAAWDKDAEKALREVIGNALQHGLKPSLFLKEGALPDDESARDAVLTKAALDYADALARGYADPKKLSETYTIARPKSDAAAGLAKAIENGDLKAWFETLPPQTDEYRALLDAHLRYLRLTADGSSVAIPAGKAIKPGQRDPRLAAITAALRNNEYLPPASDPPPLRYAGPLVDAIKRLQADNGFEPDGVIGKDTLAALNAGPAARARQLAIAMERMRWLEREPARTRIDVNTAAAFLDYWREGRRVDRRNVVVGEPGWETPQLQSPLFQLVANPMWRVPDSIIEDELSKKSGAYLAANGFEHRDGRLVQRSGPKNALGVVKFDLKNDQAIYLHDTPAKALFTANERHRSHGCIRVHNALQFADLIASHEGVRDKFEMAMRSREENYVELGTAIPVRLLYRTAFWDGSRVQFRPDVYGWDDEVGAALGLIAGPARKAWQHKDGDVGP